MRFSLKNRNLNYPLIIVFTVFGIIFSLISLPNHYFLRTSALDLGMFNHAIYQFAHFKMADFTLGTKGHVVPYLGDHFSLITILISPLYYLFGTYTLLIVQVFSIIFGGLGIYKYSKLYENNKLITIFVIQFFSIWGIYSALSFDFHTNVLAAMFVVWFIYYYTLGLKLQTLVFFVLILISKENMALWLIFILIGLMLKGGLKRYKDWFRYEIPLILFCVIYFAIIMGIIMPNLLDGKGYNQLNRYASLGTTLSEILSNIIYHPWNTIKLLWVNTNSNPNLDNIKVDTYLMILYSGGIALIARPYYLVMLIPIIAQKMFSSSPGMWSLKAQYSIEFVPIISLAFIDFSTSIKSKAVKTILIYIITAGTIISTFSKLDRRKGPFKINNIRFYQKQHYTSQLNIKEINKGLKLIPENANLSIHSRLAPHLAFRDTIFLFPHIHNADYIALITKNAGTYPLKKKSFIKKVSTLRSNDKWKIIHDHNDLLILKRKD